MDEAWRELFEKETGRPPERLARPLPGGIPVDPLYSDPPPGFTGGRAGEWPFARGARPTPPAPLSCPRIDPSRPDAVTRVEEAARLGARAFWVDGTVPPAVAAAVEHVAGQLVGGADPLGDLVRNGAGANPLEEAVGEAVRAAAGARGAPLVASGLPYEAAGADPARQLAYAVSTAILYARRLGEAGLSPADATERITFRLAAGADVLATIPLLRAARVVWAKVRAAAGAGGSISRLHVVSSERELSRRDPWVNMLRGTSHAFSALAAGADWITVRPFDEAVRPPDAVARRLALHTLTILDRECFVGAVADPAGGAWALEHLTDRIARSAWDEMRAIEAAGGMGEALVSGEIRRRIDAAWAARSADLATRRQAITGVSEFADPAEEPLAGAGTDGPGPAAPAAPGAGETGDFPFPRRHDDDAYDALRARTDELAAGPGRPAVFLANLGPAAEHRPRTGFALNGFRVGGFEPVESASTGDVPPQEAAGALAREFAASGARIACLCGSDERYAAAAAPVAGALREAGATAIVLAGGPEGREGLADAFVHLGCDLPAVLGGLLDRQMAGSTAR